MNLPTIPKEVAVAVEYILGICDGDIKSVLEEMVNTLPATSQGLTIRQFSRENWELMIQALVYGYKVGE